MASELNSDLTREKVNAAQHKLVNTAISVALDMAYEAAKNQGKPMANIWGQTKEETLNNLINLVEDDRKRVREYNKLVKPIGITACFDLSLKSSGAKTPESIARKLETKERSSASRITDVVRMSAVSEDISILDKFSSRMEKKLLDGESKKPRKPVTILEGWRLGANGMMNNVIKSSVDGITAEIQLLPRQQARMGTRITHKYFDAFRILDSHPLTSERKEDFIQKYNKIARWVNKVSKDVPLNDFYVLSANRLLLTNDMSSVTFDAVSEGGEAASNGTSMQHANNALKIHGYERIFKNVDELSYYVAGLRKYIASEDCAPLQIPMPIITKTSIDADDMMPLYEARTRLLRLTQITHAFYMEAAPKETREIYANMAHALNAKTPDTGAKVIPESIIERLDPDKNHQRVGQQHAR
jgi:hypothetical protein